ncbi:hypothetical protein P22_0154 [Propionispora sp. 2/2-37]|uniref:type IV pilus biogenesis protein PilM n=1 Tax=Propionispora sp. 2/2-37 TaxID=1677858 RepID=UPI0006C59463|nr:type IV pilus assembly protein PilM [Propionispora sp. 2/2-37]CUH94092.1 hypothetical protein P22_0154 [Propionispora sp. 2/2-37]
MFGRKNALHLGLDIGPDSVKVVEVLKDKNTIILNRMGVMPLFDNLKAAENTNLVDMEQTAVCIRNLLAVTGVSCRHVTVGMSGKSVFFREISLPDMSNRELREAIKWEIDYYVPYAAGTYFYDFAVLNAEQQQEESKVFIVASLKENIEAIEKICTLVGLRVVAVEFEALAMKRTLEREDNIVVIEICDFWSQVILYQNALPVFVRTIPVGAEKFKEVFSHDDSNVNGVSRQQDLPMTAAGVIGAMSTPLANAVQDFCQEIHRTLEYYQIQNQQVTIDRFYLTGCTERISHITTLISDLLGKPVSIHNSLQHFRLHSSYDQVFLQRQGPRMNVAFGLALRGLDND